MQKEIKVWAYNAPYEMQLNDYGLKKWKNSSIDFPEDFIEKKLQDKMKEFCINENIYFIDAADALVKYLILMIYF